MLILLLIQKMCFCFRWMMRWQSFVKSTKSTPHMHPCSIIDLLLLIPTFDLFNPHSHASSLCFWFPCKFCWFIAVLGTCFAPNKSKMVNETSSCEKENVMMGVWNKSFCCVFQTNCCSCQKTSSMQANWHKLLSILLSAPIKLVWKGIMQGAIKVFATRSSWISANLALTLNFRWSSAQLWKHKSDAFFLG